MANKCKKCGCLCVQCVKNERKHSDVHLHAEIENLRQCLLERDSHIVTMETQFLNEAEKFPNGELASIKEEILIWQDKYSRLYEAHKRIQKVNQNLEDKLLRIVDKCETEKGAFAKDIATLSHRLADANYTIHRLTQDNEKYRHDVNLAIQLLQCKPSNFIGQKYEMLPPEVQAKVRTYTSQKSPPSEETSNSEVKSITVPISTFPPTAMVYSVTKQNVDKHDGEASDDSKPPVDMVSVSIMAKVLEDREKERTFGKHCGTCTCSKSILKVDSETQTPDDSLLEDHNVQSTERPNTVVDYANGSDKYHRHSDQYNYRTKSQDYEKPSDPTKTKTQSTERGIQSPETKQNGKNTEALKISNRGNQGSTRGGLSSKSLSKTQVDAEEVPEKWCKLDGKSSKDLKNLESSRSTWKEQEDIINERLWKNTWMTFPSRQKTETENTCSEIEGINDRVWKNNRSRVEDTNKSTQLTLIEVKNADELSSQSVGNGQAEATASSSFSSDSVVISTSDPSSISSDAGKSSNNRDNDTSLSSSKQERAPGPRNCLVRVKPGLKNILLDNVGTYQTVLYTTGNDRPNTILVHSMKPRLERSASLSSEDNSSILPHDNTQLQRVAEWVESSVHADDKLKFKNEISQCDKSINKALHVDRMIGRDGFNPVAEITKLDKDLITFETSSDEDRSLSICEKTGTHHELSEYEVKITKEMEETYLKLAASLDPVALNLASSTGPDLTIEKYRKDHKRFCQQKLKMDSNA